MRTRVNVRHGSCSACNQRARLHDRGTGARIRDHHPDDPVLRGRGPARTHARGAQAALPPPGPRPPEAYSRGKRLGFTLGEIRETFDLYDQAPDGSRQLRYYLGVLDEKREQLNRQRRDLEDALAELEQSYQRCQELLARQEADKSA